MWRIKRLALSNHSLHAIIVFFPFLTGLYSIHLGQDVNWDLLNYHLYNPYAYINNRLGFDLAPAGMQTFFNPMLDVVYYKAVMVLSPKMAGFLIGFIQGLSFVFIYKIAALVIGREKQWSALLLSLFGILSVGFMSEIGRTLHDSLIGVATLFALWIGLKSLVSVDESKIRALNEIGVSGAFFGLAVALKLVFAIYALAFVVVIISASITWKTRVQMLCTYGMCALLAFGIVDGYWLYRMWSDFGNPVFPQFNNIFHGPLAQNSAMKDVRFLPKNLFEAVFFPAVFTNNPLSIAELKYNQISWVFAYFMFFAFCWEIFFKIEKKSVCSYVDQAKKSLFIYIGVAYFLWVVGFGIYRYLIPIEVLLPLVIFIALDLFLLERISRVAVFVFVSALTFYNLNGIPDWGRTHWSESIFTVEGSLLNEQDSPAVVFLFGQPLAWLVPALDINVPFVQLSPNMLVSDEYWIKAANSYDGRSGKKIIIYDSLEYIPARNRSGSSGIDDQLLKLGLGLDESSCTPLVASIGGLRKQYKTCEVNRLP